jgi:ribonuclease HI
LQINVSTHHPKTLVIKEILWQSPLANWIKCNINRAAKSNSGIVACGGVFRNFDAELLFCFTQPLSYASSYQAELCAAMTTIEVAHRRN